MRKMLRILAAAGAMSLLPLLFSSCEEDKTPSPLALELTAGAVTPDSFTFTVASQGGSVGYYKSSASFLATGAFVEQNGVKAEANGSVTLSNLYPVTDYKVTVAVWDGQGNYLRRELVFRTPAVASVVSAAVEGVPSYSSFTVKLTPNEETASYRFAVGKASDRETDRAAFIDGTMEGTLEVDGNKPATADAKGLKFATDYIVYASGVNLDGKEDVVTELTVRTADAPLTFEVTDVNAAVVKAEVGIDAMFASYGAVVVAPDIFDEFVSMMGSEQATAEMLYEAAMMETIAQSGPVAMALNGSPGFDYELIVLPIAEDGSYGDFFAYEFSSPAFVDNAPTASMTIEVVEADLLPNSARIIFDMDEQTTAGYYQGLYTKTQYDDIRAEGPAVGEDPDEHLRNYTAFYGTQMIEDEDHVWPSLTPETEYYAVGCPFNVNGIEGYGQMQVVHFVTPAGDAPAAAASAAPLKAGMRKPLCSREQLELR